PAIGKIVQKLKADIDNPLAVILIINTAAHTIGAAVAGSSFNAMGYGKYMSAFSLIFTLVMVQYIEILPKTIGVRFNIAVMRIAARPLQVLSIILKPLIKFSRLLNRPFEVRNPERPSATDEISALAALARSSQIISSRQERIIKMVPHLSERTAAQVMIDVDNISFLHEDMTVSTAINVSARDFHTRYPVRSAEDPDKILGYINIKELISADRSSKGENRLTEIMRPIGFVDPDDSAAELLEKFAAQHCHMTIVRDPADGKVRGLVTLEDIVEELLGDLDDEFDPLPRTFYSPRESFWIVGGGISLTQLARDTGLDLPRRVEPVSAWFERILKRHPRVGDSIVFRNAEFYVRKIRRYQVWEFNLKRHNEDD
ncbi:MAG: DUF21 domain-containing protein, partial [Lentisphaeria bacterium]|nr:DUF21 domain-containing protein [Lentisphaeria bacterium]